MSTRLKGDSGDDGDPTLKIDTKGTMLAEIDEEFDGIAEHEPCVVNEPWAKPPLERKMTVPQLYRKVTQLEHKLQTTVKDKSALEKQLKEALEEALEAAKDNSALKEKLKEALEEALEAVKDKSALEEQLTKAYKTIHTALESGDTVVEKLKDMWFLALIISICAGGHLFGLFEFPVFNYLGEQPILARFLTIGWMYKIGVFVLAVIAFWGMREWTCIIKCLWANTDFEDCGKTWQYIKTNCWDNPTAFLRVLLFSLAYCFLGKHFFDKTMGTPGTPQLLEDKSDQIAVGISILVSILLKWFEPPKVADAPESTNSKNSDTECEEIAAKKSDAKGDEKAAAETYTKRAVA